MTGPTRKTRGFTLLEMLAATAIMAVLAGSLYASLYIAFKARRSALSSVETVRTAAGSMDLIRADLQSAMIPNGILAGGFVGQSKAASGSAADTLSFYASAMDIEPRPGVGDVKKIEYSCEPGADSNEAVLVRRITTNLLAPTVPQPAQEIVCRGVRTFTLRYFDGANWQDNWDSGAQGNILPAAVEVTMEFQGGSGRAACQVSRIFLIPCAQGSDATAPAGAAP